MAEKKNISEEIQQENAQQLGAASQQGATSKQGATSQCSDASQRSADDMDEGIDIMKYAKILWDERKRVIKITAVFVVIGLVAALIETRKYVTTVTFAPELNNGSKSSSLSSLAAMVGLGGMQMNSGPDAYSVLFYPDIVNSTPFVAELVDIPVVTKDGEKMTYAEFLKQERTWSLFSLPMKALSGIISLFAEKDTTVVTRVDIDLFQLTRKQESLLNAMKLRLTMTVDKKSGESSLVSSSSDPYVAAIVADSATAHLQRYVSDYRTKKARQNLEYYQKLAEQSYEKYREASSAFAHFQDHNRGLISNAVMTESSRLQNELNIATQLYTQMKQQEELARGKVYEDNPIFALIQPASVPLKSANSKRKILITYTFLGFVLACGWILRKELLATILPPQQQE